MKNFEKIYIILSAQRSGSSFLVSSMTNLNANYICLGEAFININSHKKHLYPHPLIPHHGSLKNNLNKKNLGIESMITEYIPKTKVLVFKVFNGHIANNNLSLLTNISLPKKFIILKRSLKDSYKSLCRAYQTGDWTTNRSLNPNAVKPKNFQPKSPPTFDQYSQTINNWFDKCEKHLNQEKEDFTFVSFDDLISKNFNFNSLL